MIALAVMLLTTTLVVLAVAGGTFLCLVGGIVVALAGDTDLSPLSIRTGVAMVATGLVFVMAGAIGCARMLAWS